MKFKNKILIKEIKTPLSNLTALNKETLMKKIIKYLKNPIKFFSSTINYIKIKFYEIDWEERTKRMGNSSVFGTKLSIEMQEKLTNEHKKIISRFIKKSKKKLNILDFGCGYGRFSDFFINQNYNYYGVENNKFFLENFKNSKNKKILSLDLLKKKFNKFFDVIFIFNVLGNFKKRNAIRLFNLIESKIKPNGKLLVNEIISSNNISGEWNFRTENFYTNLFKNFNISTKYYFLEDKKFQQIFFGSKK